MELCDHMLGQLREYLGELYHETLLHLSFSSYRTLTQCSQSNRHTAPSVPLYIYLSIYLSIWLYFSFSFLHHVIYLISSVYLSKSPFSFTQNLYLFFYLSVSLPTYLSFFNCLSLFPSSVSVSLCLCLSLSLSLSLSPRDTENRND